MARDDAGLGREFLGTGWATPVTIAPDTGLIALVSYEKDIQQSIRIVLSTAKGERVMRPGFGCGIHDMPFAVVTARLIGEIETSVRDALRTYEARIEVRRVSVDSTRVSLGRLDISVDYEIRATNQPDNYVYPFYFQESASR
ncbi:GPW/gp25 family protein [Actinoplanes sp. NPDC048796]|uniref:GPW/gp25 family protein n=1 Tax=Actinoplanes sp. NPDC048796 TaxID=3155640 RepID=UPI0033D7C582